MLRVRGGCCIYKQIGEIQRVMGNVYWKSPTPLTAANIKPVHVYM